MKKLINILNEYRTEKGERNLNEFEVSQTLDSLNYLRLFIKRLVDNDKIKIPHELDELPQVYGVDYNSNECKSDRLIMLLSISSSPIDDLISYLK